MKLRPILHCTKNWDFSPLKKESSALPPLSWGNELLNGFHHPTLPEIQVLDIKERISSPLDAIKACHPELSLPELARLWNRVKNLESWQADRERWGSVYNLRWNHELEITLTQLIETPKEFQHWCSIKQVGTQDIAPLRSIDFKHGRNDLNKISPKDLASILLKISHSDLSKSWGIQALEWAIDLLVSGVSVSEILDENRMPREKGKGELAWVNGLRQMRFPLTMAQDEQRQRQVRKLPWPSRTQAQWMRQGDRGFLEIKMQIESLDDLGKKLSSLRSLQESLNQTGQIWKN